MKKTYILILCSIVNPLIIQAVSERDTFKKLEQIEQHLDKLTKIMEKQEEREQDRQQAQKKAFLQRLQQQQQDDLAAQQQSVKKTILLGLLQYTCLHIAPQIIAHIEAMLIRKLTEKTLDGLDRVTGEIIGSRIPLFEFRFGQWLTMPDDERAQQNLIRKFCNQDPKIKDLFTERSDLQKITPDDVRKALIQDINNLNRQRSTKTPQFIDVTDIKKPEDLAALLGIDISDMTPEDLAAFWDSAKKAQSAKQTQSTSTPSSANSTQSKKPESDSLNVSPLNSSDELNNLLGRKQQEHRTE